LRTESLRVVLLDTRYRLMRVESVSVGSMNESIAHPREIFRPAITYSAYAVIVVHNHPSGDASPSQTDHSLTRRLAEAAELLQIKFSITSSSAHHRKGIPDTSVSRKQAFCRTKSEIRTSKFETNAHGEDSLHRDCRSGRANRHQRRDRTIFGDWTAG